MLSFNTEVREQTGKAASRRLRHQNKIPATLYGGYQQPIALALNQDAVNNAEAKTEFYQATLVLVISGAETKAKVQAVQRHPFKPKLTHIDFLRIE